MLSFVGHSNGVLLLTLAERCPVADTPEEQTPSGVYGYPSTPVCSLRPSRGCLPCTRLSPSVVHVLQGMSVGALVCKPVVVHTLHLRLLDTGAFWRILDLLHQLFSVCNNRACLPICLLLCCWFLGHNVCLYVECPVNASYKS